MILMQVRFGRNQSINLPEMSGIYGLYRYHSVTRNRLVPDNPHYRLRDGCDELPQYVTLVRFKSVRSLRKCPTLGGFV
jgi:hypothetical protein